MSASFEKPHLANSRQPQSIGQNSGWLLNQGADPIPASALLLPSMCVDRWEVEHVIRNIDNTLSIPERNIKTPVNVTVVLLTLAVAKRSRGPLMELALHATNENNLVGNAISRGLLGPPRGWCASGQCRGW